MQGTKQSSMYRSVFDRKNFIRVTLIDSIRAIWEMDTGNDL